MLGGKQIHVVMGVKDIDIGGRYCCLPKKVYSDKPGGKTARI